MLAPRGGGRPPRPPPRPPEPMRILVTGSSGHLGEALMRVLGGEGVDDLGRQGQLLGGQGAS